MLRALSNSVVRNADENPRTPVSAATPIATDMITNVNFPREECNSRVAIRAAVPYESLAIYKPTDGALTGDAAAFTTSLTTSPSRSVITRLACAASAGSCVTSTSVVPST